MISTINSLEGFVEFIKKHYENNYWNYYYSDAEKPEIIDKIWKQLEIISTQIKKLYSVDMRFKYLDVPSGNEQIDKIREAIQELTILTIIANSELLELKFFRIISHLMDENKSSNKKNKKKHL